MPCMHHYSVDLFDEATFCIVLYCIVLTNGRLAGMELGHDEARFHLQTLQERIAAI